MYLYQLRISFCKILLKISEPKLGLGCGVLCVQNSVETDMTSNHIEVRQPNRWTYGLVNHILM